MMTQQSLDFIFHQKRGSGSNLSISYYTNTSPFVRFLYIYNSFQLFRHNYGTFKYNIEINNALNNNYIAY